MPPDLQLGTSVETPGVNLLKLREALAGHADGNPERSHSLLCGTCRDLTGSTYGRLSMVKRKSRLQTVLLAGGENHSGMKRKVTSSNLVGDANFSPSEHQINFDKLRLAKSKG